MNHRALALGLVSSAIAAALLGCPDKTPPAPAGNTASSSSATAASAPGSASAVASASAAPKPKGPPCTVEAPVSVATNARRDAGLTVVKLDTTHSAIGFAVGGGTPKVAMVEPDGTVAVHDAAWGHVANQEQPQPKMYRAILRVTPLGAANNTFRVGMDLKDTPVDKTVTGYNIRCGPADGEPVVGDNSPLNFDNTVITEDDVAKLAAGPDGDSDIRECRTFSNGSDSWVLATEVRRHGPGDDHSLAVNWIMDNVPGKTRITEPVVYSAKVDPKDKKYPPGTLDHYLMPVSVHNGADGYLMGSIEGGLLIARRTNALEKAGGPWWVSVEGGYPGLPSLMHEHDKVLLLATAVNKTDLYGSTFDWKDAPVKPTKLPLADSNPPTEGIREFPSSFPAGDGNWWVSFVDGATQKKGRARVTVAAGDMTQKIDEVFDVSPPDVQVVEARVVGLGGKKALVAWLDVNNNLTASVVNCRYKGD